MQIKTDCDLIKFQKPFLIRKPGLLRACTAMAEAVGCAYFTFWCTKKKQAPG